MHTRVQQRLSRVAAAGRSAIAATMLLLPLAAASADELPKVPPELEGLQKSLAAYKDPVKAVHDGYLSTLGCIVYPDGAMGVHFVNPQLMGPSPDPAKPSVLLYEPDAAGRLNLVGAEWLIPLATGVKGRPSLFGQDFDGPMEGHTPLLPKEFHHYDLHVWLFKANPSGLFHHSNPSVSCGNGPYVVVSEPPPHVSHD